MEKLLESVNPNVTIGGYTLRYLLSIKKNYDEIQKVLPKLESVLSELLEKKDINSLNETIQQMLFDVKRIQKSVSGGNSDYTYYFVLLIVVILGVLGAVTGIKWYKGKTYAKKGTPMEEGTPMEGDGTPEGEEEEEEGTPEGEEEKDLPDPEMNEEKIRELKLIVSQIDHDVLVIGSSMLKLDSGIKSKSNMYWDTIFNSHAGIDKTYGDWDSCFSNISDPSSRRYNDFIHNYFNNFFEMFGSEKFQRIIIQPDVLYSIGRLKKKEFLYKKFFIISIIDTLLSTTGYISIVLDEIFPPLRLNEKKIDVPYHELLNYMKLVHSWTSESNIHGSSIKYSQYQREIVDNSNAKNYDESPVCDKWKKRLQNIDGKVLVIGASMFEKEKEKNWTVYSARYAGIYLEEYITTDANKKTYLESCNRIYSDWNNFGNISNDDVNAYKIFLHTYFAQFYSLFGKRKFKQIFIASNVIGYIAPKHNVIFITTFLTKIADIFLDQNGILFVKLNEALGYKEMTKDIFLHNLNMTKGAEFNLNQEVYTQFTFKSKIGHLFPNNSTNTPYPNIRAIYHQHSPLPPQEKAPFNKLGGALSGLYGVYILTDKPTEELNKPLLLNNFDVLALKIHEFGYHENTEDDWWQFNPVYNMILTNKNNSDYKFSEDSEKKYSGPYSKISQKILDLDNNIMIFHRHNIRMDLIYGFCVVKKNGVYYLIDTNPRYLTDTMSIIKISEIVAAKNKQVSRGIYAVFDTVKELKEFIEENYIIDNDTPDEFIVVSNVVLANHPAKSGGDDKYINISSSCITGVYIDMKCLLGAIILILVIYLIYLVVTVKYTPSRSENNKKIYSITQKCR